jgi:hypothetical protein
LTVANRSKVDLYTLIICKTVLRLFPDICAACWLTQKRRQKNSEN